MKNIFKLTLIGLAFSSLNYAADVESGKEMFNDECSSCHKDSSAFTRPDKERKVHNFASLKKQVHRCVGMTGASLFEEDEVDVVAHLNETYYKFAKPEKK